MVQPSIDKLQEIARILETSVAYLVDGVEAIISEEDRELLAALHAIKNDALRLAAVEHIKQLALV